MKFVKDLLFFEVSTTGPDPERDAVIQLSAVLLDKDNLLEKDQFNCYVRVSYLDSVLRDHAETLGVPFEVIKRSPKVYDAIKQFFVRFGSAPLLATHVTQNLLFLRAAFKKAGAPFSFDRHVVELWTLGYVYLLNYGVRKMPTLDTFAEFFRIPFQNRGDAAERVRLETEVFRKIIQGTK